MEHIPGITPVRRAFWRRYWRVAVVLAVLAAAPFAAFEGYKAWLRLDPEWRFVERVLLDGKTGGETGIVRRWTRPVTVVVEHAADADRMFIGDVIREINDVIVGSRVYLRVAIAGDRDIDVSFVGDEAFPRIYEQLSGELVGEARGYAFVWQDDRRQIDQARIVIRNSLDDVNRQAVTVHEFAHAMGVLDHSPAFAESVVYKRGSDNSISVRLSPIDRRLLRLQYMRLHPGAGWLEVRNAYTNYWATLAP